MKHVFRLGTMCTSKFYYQDPNLFHIPFSVSHFTDVFEQDILYFKSQAKSLVCFKVCFQLKSCLLFLTL